MANLRLHIVLVYLVSLLTSRSHGHLQPWKKHAALFILGDSVFDAGNNNYINTSILGQANFEPYGMTFFKNPTGRFSDGRLISDFIAQYAHLPLIKPYLEPGFNDYSHGVNFASSGAGVLDETNTGLVIDLKTQVNNFKKVANALNEKMGEIEAKTLISGAVYLISIGGNDLFSIFLRNSTVLQSFSHEEYVGMMAGNATNMINEIYMAGGRKFVLLNLEPIGCFPVVRAFVSGDNCLEEMNQLAELYNKAISTALLKLQGRLTGFRYSLFDTHTFIKERTHNPSKYGFKDANVACCGSGPFKGLPSCGGRNSVEYEVCSDPSQYLLFDFAHYTEMANQQCAKLLWSGSSKYAGPYNVQELFKL